MSYDYTRQHEAAAVVGSRITHWRNHYGVSGQELANAVTLAGYPCHPSTLRTIEAPSGHASTLTQPLIQTLARVLDVPREELCPDEIFFDSESVREKPHRASKYKVDKETHYPDKLPEIDFNDNPPGTYPKPCSHAKDEQKKIRKFAQHVKWIRDLHRKSPVSDRCAECQIPYSCTTYDDLDKLYGDMINSVSTTD